jgi:FkbM family methyltransferase
MSDALSVARCLRALHSGIVVPDYEKLLSQAYQRFLWSDPNPTILDIGANTGLHLTQFRRLARTSGRVIAFEPLPHLASMLTQQFRDYPNVEIRAVALSREPGTASFHFNQVIPGESGLRVRADFDKSGPVKMITVKTDTLDRQAHGLDRLTYVKIDIEGGEIDCLQGGQAVIERHRPFISVEYGRNSYLPYGNTSATLFELANSMDYVLSDLFGNLIETFEEWEQICDMSYWDYFLVPRNRCPEWKQYFL